MKSRRRFVAAALALLAGAAAPAIAQAQHKTPPVVVVGDSISAAYGLPPGAGWVVLLANNGVVNGTLVALGLVDRPLRMLGTFGSVIVATVHVLLPFMMLPIASALQDLDPALERAAQSLGATPAQTFWRVTLPLSMPGVLAGASLVVALTLGIYITPLLVAGPLQPLFAIGIYYVTLNQLNFPLGAALSFILLAFTLAVIGVVSRLLRAVKGSVAA